MIKNQSTNYFCDFVVVSDALLEDLDLESFEIFKKKSVELKRLSKEDVKIDNINILNNLGLISNNKLTQAGILLFHKDPTKWFKGAYLKIEVFKNNELLISDYLNGSIISIISLINKNFKNKYLDNGEEYLMNIIYEPIINSLLHNDYYSNIPISITINEKELTITNSFIGNDYEKKSILGKNISIINNKLIANTLYKMGIINEWGKGIKKIFKECKKVKLNKPQFNVENNLLSIKIFKRKEEIPKEKKEHNGKISGIVNYLNYYNYCLDSLNDIDKERLYILVENLIIEDNLSLDDLTNILKIKETDCKIFLNKIIDLKIIKLESLKYTLVKKHNLNIY